MSDQTDTATISLERFKELEKVFKEFENIKKDYENKKKSLTVTISVYNSKHHHCYPYHRTSVTTDKFSIDAPETLKEVNKVIEELNNANVEKHYQIIQEMNSYRDTLLSFANMTFWQRVKHIFSNKVGGELR